MTTIFRQLRRRLQRGSRVLLSLNAFVIPVGLHAGDSMNFDTSELIRASVIEKIARFIEWPESSRQAPVKLCVLARTSLLPALQHYYSGEIKLDQKPIELSLFERLDGIEQCDIIYLDPKQDRQLTDIVSQIGDAPVLVITEKQDAVLQGSHVDFYIEDNRLRLEVNRSRLASSGFNVSYHLFKVARIVE